MSTKRGGLYFTFPGPPLPPNLLNPLLIYHNPLQYKQISLSPCYYSIFRFIFGDLDEPQLQDSGIWSVENDTWHHVVVVFRAPEDCLGFNAFIDGGYVTQRNSVPVSNLGGGGARGPCPPVPWPVKNSHKNDCRARWLIFHVSCPIQFI